VAPSRPGSSPGCSAGEFRVPGRRRLSPIPARFSTMGSAYCSRVIAFAAKYIRRSLRASITTRS
jgi:hypothetical protein